MYRRRRFRLRHRPMPTNFRARYGVFKPVGSSFADAIKAANKFSMNAVDEKGLPKDVAHAVLQSADGQYYVVWLWDRFGTFDATLDGSDFNREGRHVVVAGVEALNPDVKAVVDRDEWINFSGQDVAVNLAD